VFPELNTEAKFIQQRVRGPRSPWALSGSPGRLSLKPLDLSDFDTSQVLKMI